MVESLQKRGPQLVVVDGIKALAAPQTESLGAVERRTCEEDLMAQKWMISRTLMGFGSTEESDRRNRRIVSRGLEEVVTFNCDMHRWPAADDAALYTLVARLNKLEEEVEEAKLRAGGAENDPEMKG